MPKMWERKPTLARSYVYIRAYCGPIRTLLPIQEGASMLSEDATFEEIDAYFKNDKFAAMAGCELVDARKGHAVVEMPITDNLRNAQGGVMGGAIFTLADFALAVACNVGEDPTVSVSNTIEFLSSTKADTLIAMANTEKSGRHLGFYTVDVVDSAGKHIARMSATCYR